MQKLAIGLCLSLMVCLALGLSGCGGPTASADSESEGEIPTVSVIQAERKTLKRTTTQPATVAAYFEAEIYAKVSGYLTELKHDIGDTVEAGAALGVIHIPEMDKQMERQDAEIRKLEADANKAAAGVQVAKSLKTAADAELIQAQAEVTKAVALVAADRRERDRTRDLVQRQSVADRLLDEAQKRFESSEAAQEAAEAAVKSAQARLTVADSKIAAAEADLEAAKAEVDVAKKHKEELEALVNYATLSAPFAGVVTARHVDVGDLVRNTQASSGSDRHPLFCVSQIDRVRIRVAIPENDAPWADAGDAVTIRLRAIPGSAIPAKLKRVAGRLDPSTRTMLAEIELKNSDQDQKLIPGMFGEVTISLEERDALVLPAGSVRFDSSGKATVYLLDDQNTIAPQDVVTGWDDGKLIEIVSGLTGEERIVADTIERFEPGQKVNVK